MYLHLHASPHSSTQPSNNIYGKNHTHQQTKLDITARHFLLQKQLDTMKLNSVTALPSHSAHFHLMVTSNP